MSKLDFIAHICELSKRPIDAEGVFTTAVFDLRTTLTVRVALRCRLPRYSLPPVAWPRCRCVDAEQISISRWSPKLTSISCCRRRPPLMTTVPLRPNSWLYSASTDYWTTSLVALISTFIRSLLQEPREFSNAVGWLVQLPWRHTPRFV